jgi:hypothetical protein
LALIRLARAAGALFGPHVRARSLQHGAAAHGAKTLGRSALKIVSPCIQGRPVLSNDRIGLGQSRLR